MKIPVDMMTPVVFALSEAGIKYKFGEMSDGLVELRTAPGGHEVAERRIAEERRRAALSPEERAAEDAEWRAADDERIRLKDEERRRSKEYRDATGVSGFQNVWSPAPRDSWVKWDD